MVNSPQTIVFTDDKPGTYMYTCTCTSLHGETYIGY